VYLYLTTSNGTSRQCRMFSWVIAPTFKETPPQQTHMFQITFKQSPACFNQYWPPQGRCLWVKTTCWSVNISPVIVGIAWNTL
jgi:hypothetical protein